MNPIAFIPKEDPEIPDNYGMKVDYLTGKSESFELASHMFHNKTKCIEFVTKDDLWSWIPLASIQRLEFDKRMSKLVEIKKKKNDQGN